MKHNELIRILDLSNLDLSNVCNTTERKGDHCFGSVSNTCDWIAFQSKNISPSRGNLKLHEELKSFAEAAGVPQSKVAPWPHLKQFRATKSTFSERHILKQQATESGLVSFVTNAAKEVASKPEEEWKKEQEGGAILLLCGGGGRCGWWWWSSSSSSFFFFLSAVGCWWLASSSSSYLPLRWSLLNMRVGWWWSGKKVCARAHARPDICDRGGGAADMILQQQNPLGKESSHHATTSCCRATTTTYSPVVLLLVLLW
jgi:hypothetical protein